MALVCRHQNATRRQTHAYFPLHTKKKCKSNDILKNTTFVLEKDKKGHCKPDQQANITSIEIDCLYWNRLSHKILTFHITNHNQILWRKSPFQEFAAKHTQVARPLMTSRPISVGSVACNSTWIPSRSLLNLSLELA